MNRTDRAAWLAGLRPVIQNWIAEQCRDRHEPRFTQAYADLIIAFGLAWVEKAADDCQRLIDEAQRRLESSWDDAHAFLFHAYQYRIAQALAGQDVCGSLPAELLQARRELSGPREVWDWRQLERSRLAYVIDRLRASSEILEPLAGVDGYREELRPTWERGREVRFLPDIADSTELSESIRELLSACADRPPSDQSALVQVALRLCFRVDETLVGDLLDRVVPLLGQLPELWDQAALLEAALAAVGHRRAVGRTKELLSILMSLLDSEQGTRLSTGAPLVSQSVRTLRKLGLWEDLEPVLNRLEERILQGESPARLRSRLQELSSRNRKAISPLPPLVSLAHVAGGWLDVGQRERALRILDEVEDLLLVGHLPPHHLMDLPSIYVRVLGRLPAAEGMRRMEVMFRQLKSIIDPLFSTSTHYALRLLKVVESTVLATMVENLESVPPSPAVVSLR